MPFADLATLSLDEFVAANRGDDQTLWFFMHIPKTAGSSFASELAARRKPYRNIHIDGRDRALPHGDLYRRATDAFLADFPADQYRSASGHLSYPLARLITEQLPQTRMVSMLRRPEARVISDYRYQRTPAHPPHEQFRADFPTLESYVDAAVSHNKMTHFLCGQNRDITPDEAIRHIGQAFAFLGLLEMYPLSFRTIFRLMGADSQRPTEHKRQTPDTPDTAVVVTPALRTRIQETNRLDQAVYDHVRHMLTRHRAGLVRPPKPVRQPRPAAVIPVEAVGGPRVADPRPDLTWVEGLLPRMQALVAPDLAALLARPGFADDLRWIDAVNWQSERDEAGNLICWNRAGARPVMQLGPDARNNLVVIGRRFDMRQPVFIKGSDNCVIIGQTTKFSARIGIAGDNCLFFSGAGATCNKANFVMNGKGQAVLVGADAMISFSVVVRATDSHAVVDLNSRKVVNLPESIVIGPHVWLAEGARLLKGVRIGTGAMIGAGAIVTSDIPSRAIATGVPARAHRGGISWTRSPEPTDAELEGLEDLLAGWDPVVPPIATASAVPA